MPAKKPCPKGKRLSKDPSKRKKRVCVKKRKVNPALNRWRKAAQAEGFMKAGEGFKPLPKKGTAGYKAIKARAERMK